MPSAKQMQMQMVDRLAAIRAGVDHDAVTTIQPRTARHLRGLRHQVSKQRSMLFLRVCLGGDVFPGNDEQMGRSLWVQVREAQA